MVQSALTTPNYLMARPGATTQPSGGPQAREGRSPHQTESSTSSTSNARSSPAIRLRMPVPPCWIRLVMLGTATSLFGLAGELIKYVMK